MPLPLQRLVAMRRPQRFAAALALLTFALVVIGGIVHNTGSSLACPDWPLCNGTAFPQMVGSVLIEHGHRLTAFAVVMGTVALLIGLAVRGEDRGATKVAVLALGLVIVQALLGAITVKYRLPPAVSSAHLATSMLYFATVIYLALRLRQNAAPALSPRLQRLTLAAALLVYAQLILGAAVRHLGAGLVCRDLIGCSWLHADYTMQLHMAHRALALLVLLFVGYVSAAVFRASSGLARVLALSAPLLVLVQITLGLLTIVSFRDFVPLTAHLAVAALLFADLVALCLVSRGRLRQIAAPVEGVPLGAMA